MKIRKSALGADDARAAYADRYRRRSQARTPRKLLAISPAILQKVHLALYGQPYDHAIGSKPNHAARAVGLPIFYLGDRKRPVQREHPATAPLSRSGRWHRYEAQNAGRPLTARQRRRMNHKSNRAIGRWTR